MRKYIIIFVFLLLIPLAVLFAGGSSEGKSGYSIYYIPSNVANNQNVMVELTTAKTVNTSNLGSSFASATQYSYGEDNLVVCSLMDTLKNTIQSSNVELTITSADSGGFFFKKDGNETEKVPFEIEIYCVAFYKGDDSTTYASREYNKKLPLSSNEVISYTAKTKPRWLSNVTSTNYTEQTSLTKSSASQYILSMSSSEFTNTIYAGFLNYDTNVDYPNLIKYYYVCLKIADNPNLEEGLYTATFSLNATFTKQEVNAEATSGSINETISVKGYVGEKPELSDTAYSFFISPGANTYYMDLSTQDGATIPAYDIARIQFSYTYINQTSSDPASTTRRQKYKIYISPTSSIDENGVYLFRRNGTEAQEGTFGNTVEYDLYLETSSGNYELINSSGHDYTGDGNNSATNAAAHFTTGQIGGAGKATNGGNHTYYLYPVYDRLQTATGTNSRYKESWILDQHIYLKINSDQTEIFEGDGARMHQTGSYTSLIYFTVVAN